MRTLRALTASCLLLFALAHAQKEHSLPKDLPPYGPVAPAESADRERRFSSTTG